MRNATTEVKGLSVTYANSDEFSFQMVDSKFQSSGK